MAWDAGMCHVRRWVFGASLAVALALVGPSRSEAASFFVTNTNDAGAGSLRQAILSANASPGQDGILFGISLAAGAVATITPLTPLPDITEAVSVNGYSQSGSAKNSLAAGFDAVVRVRLSGALAGPAAAGLVVKAAGVIVDGLIIDGFGGAAVQVSAGAPTGVVAVTGSVLGKGYGGLPLAGNTRGVAIDSAPNVRVGGLLAEDRNLIAGNQQEGVLIMGAGSTGISVLGNRIGLNDAGTAEGNRYGVRASGAGLSIGNHLGSGGNVVAANAEADVQIEGGSFGIYGNRIGTDDAGLASRGSLVGILVVGATAGAIGVPGAPTAAGRNFVVASSRAIELRQSSGITVANNYVCRNASGAAIGTCGRGILVQEGGSHTIGGHYVSGTRFSQGNTIASCQVGIELSQTTGNTIEANTIEANTGVGVLVSSSSDNVIGSLYDTALGGSLGNTIRRNGGGSVPPRGGLVVASGSGNALLRNAISDNAPLGIDLGGDGETVNDKHDADTGPNNGQNYPALFRVTAGATTEVEGMLASLPSQPYRLQFFRSASLNTSGHAEGQLYVGETTVTADTMDHAYWTVTLPAMAPGTIVSATATRLGGATPIETSEFSPGLAAGVSAAPTITGVTPSSGPATGGTVLTVTGSFFFITQTLVTIGGTAASDVLVTSPTSLVATTPAHGPGPVDVRVTTPVGSATRANAFTYVGTGPTETPLMSALNRLRAASTEPLEVEFEKGMPIHVAGRVPAGTSSQPPWSRAIAFLNAYRDLYAGLIGPNPLPDSLNPDELIGPNPLPGPNQVQFLPYRQHVDPDGTAHVFLQQMREGIPILDAGVAVHFRGNDFTSSSGRWLSWRSPWYGTPVDTRPTISFQDAFERAVAHVGGGTPDPSGLVGKPGLVFYWPDLDHDGTWTPPSTSPDEGVGPSCLAWRLTILAPGGPWDVVVDAEDGAILEATTRQREALDVAISDVAGATSNDCFATGAAPTLWFTEDGQVNGAAIDADGDGQNASTFIRETYTYFRRVHDRRSDDGRDGQIQVFVNYGAANSFGGSGCLRFGDDWVTRDMVPHEFTHGVTDAEANLVYQREPGAINEHMSDVFGALVDDDDWFFGDALLGNGNNCVGGAPAGTLRDMTNPPNCITGRDFDGDGNNDPFPDHVDPALDTGGIGLRSLPAGQAPDGTNDNGFVHVNSSIPNKAAYLVAEGGAHHGLIVSGLGRPVMANIWYRALARYLGVRSRLTTLRWAARTSAIALYGRVSNETCQVTNAFASVGIGSADADCDGRLASDEDDDDGDTIWDPVDNCPAIANPDQIDTDGDGLGDACDTDADGDLVLNTSDNCPLVGNPGQQDFDGDGTGDRCDDSDGDGTVDSRDNCRDLANRDQANHDTDLSGDACDADDDNDGRSDGLDNCPLVANEGQQDLDGDGVGNACDNCLAVANANQVNNDGDAWGDACDEDDDGDEVPDADDLCPLTFDPQQVDVDRNGLGLRCDSDEAAMLGGYFGWRGIEMPFLTDTPVAIPVFPCVDDGCPGGGEAFAAGQRYTLRLGGTAQVDARIVDQAGRVVARGVRGAAGQTLDFEVAPAFRAISSASLPAVAASTGRVGAAAISLTDPWAPGPDEPAYFLQLRPLTSSLIGQTVHLAVSAGLHAGPDTDGDGVADNVDSCVSVANADQVDADGDGLGDACDNCVSAANGPALPLGASAAAQADADADTTGDACDVPRFLAEGAVSEFFDTHLALVNPTATTQQLVLRLQTADGRVLVHDVALPPTTRKTIDPKSLPGFGDAEFSTAVESAGPVLVERTMTWDRQGYGSHTETATLSPGLTWYLAEGATHSGFDLFYLIQNPDPEGVADIEVTYLLPAGQPPLVRTYAVAPQSRFNIWVDTIPELADTDVSAVLRVTNGRPIIVERAMYLSRHGRFFDAGHDSAGLAAPATTWFLAEGATGPFFDLFLLIANPGTQPALVRATYLLPTGQTLVRQYRVEALSRFNIWVDLEDPVLADTAVSVALDSLEGVPIIVERAMWWGDDDGWYGAHNSAGAVATGTRWGLAEGEVGGAREAATYVLVANPSSPTATVRVQLLFEDGTTAARTFSVAGHSRFNVDVGFEFPEARDRRFGAVVESLGDPPVRIVVERAMYWSADGVFWAAGSNALGTRLR